MAQLALTYQQAAEACAVSLDVIRRAVDKGDLIPRYPTSRPVLLVKDIEDWLESRPTERR